VRSVLALAPHDELASFERRLFRLLSLAAVFDRCSLYGNVRSRVTPRYTGFGSCFNRSPFIETFSWRFAQVFRRWNTLDTVFEVLGFSRQLWQYWVTRAKSAVNVHSSSAKVSAWVVQQMSSRRRTYGRGCRASRWCIG